MRKFTNGSDGTIECEGLKKYFQSVFKAKVNFAKKIDNNAVRALGVACSKESADETKNLEKL